MDGSAPNGLRTAAASVGSVGLEHPAEAAELLRFGSARDLLTSFS
jgi:hypothetical protein